MINFEFKEEPYIILDVAMGKKLGVEKAIILRKIFGWLKHNIKRGIPHKNDNNYHDGKYWVYNSLVDWEEDIQILDRHRIRRHLKTLIDNGWVITGNFNQRRGDRTTWYSIEWTKFFSEFPHFGQCTSQQEESKCFNDKQNASTTSKMNRAAAKCDDVTNSITQLSERNDHNTTPDKPSDGSRGGERDDPTPPPKTDINVEKRSLEIKKEQANFSQKELELGNKWLKFASENMKWKSPRSGWNIEIFAKAIAKVKKNTDLNDDGIAAVLNFIERDDFWSRNCLSPASLLKKNSSGIRKIDTILLRMRPKEDKELEAISKWDEQETNELPF